MKTIKKLIGRTSFGVLFLTSTMLALILVSCSTTTNPALPVGGSFVQSVGTEDKAKAIILLAINEYNKRDRAKVVGRVMSPGLIMARQEGGDWWLEFVIRYNPENFQFEFNACSEALGNRANIHSRYQKTQSLLMDNIMKVAAEYGVSQDLQWRKDARTQSY